MSKKEIERCRVRTDSDGTTGIKFVQDGVYRVFYFTPGETQKLIATLQISQMNIGENFDVEWVGRT